MSEGKRCGFYTAVWISAFVLSVALIVVGAVNQWKWNDYHHHFDSTCTLEPRIPAYLIVAGVLAIVLLVLKLLFQGANSAVHLLLLKCSMTLQRFLSQVNFWFPPLLTKTIATIAAAFDFPFEKTLSS